MDETETPLLERVLAADPLDAPSGDELGESREGRPLSGWRLGPGREGEPSPLLRVSLLAGCHADEPVGPRLLRHLVPYLSRLLEERPHDPLVARTEWWILPHANPDGEARNREWQGLSDGEVEEGAGYDLAAYLEGAVRELPGDDVEFGFPRGEGDGEARPENRAIHRWWSGSEGPFALHVSLHGMSFATGPWFLLDPAWVHRAGPLMRAMEERVRGLGYTLHDVERNGDKGFVRIRPGFSTRPDSRPMAEHFRARGDEETAALFRPSSMEAVRALSRKRGDRTDPGTLTLVSENPLFLLRESTGASARGSADASPEESTGAAARGSVGASARTPGRRPEPEEVREAMPVRDQMELQWGYVLEGLRRVREEARRTA